MCGLEDVGCIDLGYWVVDYLGKQGRGLDEDKQFTVLRIIQTSAVRALAVLLAYLPLYHSLFEIKIHSLPYLPNMKGTAAITTTPAAPTTDSAMSPMYASRYTSINLH